MKLLRKIRKSMHRVSHFLGFAQAELTHIYDEHNNVKFVYRCKTCGQFVDWVPKVEQVDSNQHG